MWPSKAAVVCQDNLEFQDIALLLRKASVLFHAVLPHIKLRSELRIYTSFHIQPYPQVSGTVTHMTSTHPLTVTLQGRIITGDKANSILNARSHNRGLSIVKGKSIPLQALTGPESSRSLRLPDFKTIGT
jgi:hypothetical protein